jgi:type 1 glutamine amidotransferase
MRIVRAAFCVLALAGALELTAVAETSVVIVVGPSSHPPGTHEVAAGGRLLEWALENMEDGPGMEAEVFSEWPKQRRVLETADAIVFLGDLFPPLRMPEPDTIMKDLGAMMDRGAGLACIHFATGVRGEHEAVEGTHPLLRWMGGYFSPRSRHGSVARVFESVTVSPASPGHPVSSGWREFTTAEEPYYNNYFGREGMAPSGNVAPLATAMLPPEAPKREVVAWGVNRPDGGRGFGVVMPHFYRNWANEDLRRLILNGIVWAAKGNVPATGVRTPPPDLAEFGPESIEPRPRTPRPREDRPR